MGYNREEIACALGMKIRKLRNERNLSQEALAFSAGVHSTYIGKMERGEKCPTVDTLYKLAKGLNVPVSELLDIPNVKPSDYSAAMVRIEAAVSKLSTEDASELANIVEKIVNLKRK